MMMDDDLLVYRDDAHARRGDDADEAARRRLRPGDGAVERRGGAHEARAGASTRATPATTRRATGTATTGSSAPRARSGSACTSTSRRPGRRGRAARRRGAARRRPPRVEAGRRASSRSSSRRSGAASPAATRTRTTAARRSRASPSGRCSTSPTRPAGCRRSTPKGRMRSPAMARELYLRGRAALDRTGHGKDTILFGETAPLGSSLRNQTSPIRPKRFYREFLCQSRARLPLQPLREVRADPRDRHRAPPVHEERLADRRATRTPTRSRWPTPTTSPSLIDSLARRTRNIKSGLPVYMTEFGFETNPPDPFSGVPLGAAGRVEPARRVPGLPQPAHQRDDAVPAARRRAGPRRAARHEAVLVHLPVRPLLQRRDSRSRRAIAYYFPFLASPAGFNAANVWGQLRFRTNGLPPGAQDTVQIQHQASGSATVDRRRRSDPGDEPDGLLHARGSSTRAPASCERSSTRSSRRRACRRPSGSATPKLRRVRRVLLRTMAVRPLLLALVLVLAAAAPADAARSMEVGVADDRLLLGSPESAAAAIADWRAAGVDTVRILARWGAYAPDPEAHAPARGLRRRATTRTRATTGRRSTARRDGDRRGPAGRWSP